VRAITRRSNASSDGIPPAPLRARSVW
jgi:hypothetical protein